MKSTTGLRRAFEVRQGEGRTLAVMAGFLCLSTANTTVLSAAKNGLFLSVYPAQLIPHAIIAAALLTALVAVVFTGVVAGTARRLLAGGLTAVLSLSILACRTAFEIDPRSAFAVYLCLSAMQVLVLTHAWDFASSLLTGRQAKRLLPLIGVGASIGAIVGGMGVAPAVLRMGTSNVLWVAIGLTLAALPLLWLVEEPPREATEGWGAGPGGVSAFVMRAGHGMRSVVNDRLLGLLALGLIALTMTGTLIDLQLKFELQRTFDRDDITALYGLLSATVGAGTLLLQLWASRVLFPRFGVSFAAMIQGGALALASGGLAVFGGLSMLVGAQALDDILQFSLQKPVEQVSLLPFPRRIKSVAVATLGGVLRPLSKATAGGIALTLVNRPALLPYATLAAALVAFLTYTRHHGAYMNGLERALKRHAVDFSALQHTPLVVDASTVSVLDQGLADDDPTVVIFATSLLEHLPPDEALPRLTHMLGHVVPEVRAEAAMVFGRLDAPLDFGSGLSFARRLDEEDVPLVVAALLETIGRVGGVEPARVQRYLEHDDPRVRRAALVALGRLGWPDADTRIRQLLSAPEVESRVLAAAAVGDLGAAHLLDALSDTIEDAEVRPTTLESLVQLGADAVGQMTSLLERRDLPLPVRRSIVTALGAVEDRVAIDALVGLLNEPALGPAALTSLTRLRASDGLAAIDPMRLRAVLVAEMQRGLKLSTAAAVIRGRSQAPRDFFIANELQALHERSVHRVLRILALSYDPERVEAVAEALLSDNPARRSNALELLEGTLSKVEAKTVMPYMDVVSEGMPLRRVVELLDGGGAIEQRPAEALLDEPEWWPRALGLHILRRDDEITAPGQAPRGAPTADGMIPLIEKVMLLKGSEFFRQFPGGDLAGIASLADVVHVRAGDTIFEQGDEGDAFYVVVTGAVAISRGATKLATLGAREGFGEMSILDRETRSATATATEDTTLLSLDRDSFDRVVEQNPAVARGVYRVLTERLRNTLAQVAAG